MIRFMHGKLIVVCGFSNVSLACCKTCNLLYLGSKTVEEICVPYRYV